MVIQTCDESGALTFNSKADINDCETTVEAGYNRPGSWRKPSTEM